jgi:FlaA1/EpsC-like NDP-sugar epimerase/lipopolysaccharide/colanic/teichoic acid biosynthesis glycosyltransferase
MKRLFDFTASAFGLIMLTPLFLLIAIAIKLDSRGPVLFRGERIGRGGKPFRICKFRTMVVGAEADGGLTHRDDARISRFGHWLRHTKLDELPQLVNVLRNEMSLVGPRPEAPQFIRYYSARQREVLSVLPGITSIASIRYRNEAALLPPDEWEAVYVETILPVKLDIELTYLENHSFGQDLLILLATAIALIKDEARFDALASAVVRSELLIGRYVSWMFMDVLLVITSFVLALLVRSFSTTLDFPQALLLALAGVIVYVGSNQFFGIYQRFWRYASAQDSVILLVASGAATLILSVIDLWLNQRVLPLSVIGLGGFFTFCLLTLVRFRRQLFNGMLRTAGSFGGIASGKGARMLVVGAGNEGQLFAWQLQNRLEGQAFQLVGFVDDDRRKRGMRVHNVPILGDRTQIPVLVSRLHVDLILIAIAPSRIRRPQELLSICQQSTAQIKQPPNLFDWLADNRGPAGWQDLTHAPLLTRETYRADDAAAHALLSERVVMVTGAAGSIGRELCLQIATHKPRTLVLVDTNESDLYNLQLELQSTCVAAELALCDITRQAELEATFANFRPQIVFHAAAYKHVPLLERHPQQAVRVNVLGTRLVHTLARAYGAQRFILISSDKAANPINVLGMTKWLSELVVTAAGDPALLSTVVRFGNVLGSRGSVVPAFQKQIAQGGPVTITHPEVTRYFMRLEEAVSLVIQAATMTRGSDVYMLDMGAPMRIADLAHQMIRQRGLRPEQDIAIKFTGLRPGEKLHEDLLADGEDQLQTEHASIFQIRRQHAIDQARLARVCEALGVLSTRVLTSDEARQELAQWVQWLRGDAQLQDLETPAVSQVSTSGLNVREALPVGAAD